MVDKDINRLAVHEAGHATVALAFDWPIVEVSVIETGERDGHVLLHTEFFTKKCNFLDGATIALSGYIAENIVENGGIKLSGSTGIRPDMVMALSLVDKYINSFGLSKDRRDDILSLCCINARIVLKEYVGKFAEITRRLSFEGLLFGNEVLEIWSS